MQFLTTIFTCIVLTVASLTFKNDTQIIVIKPISQMVEIIHKLAESPLKERKIIDDEDSSHKRYYKMLELTIYKINTLLQRGYGRLGAETIAENIAVNDNLIDPLVEGKLVYSTYLICKIKKYPEVIEYLQDEIIVFMNKIIGIIHHTSEKWGGLATKNYGEMYLITWQFDEDQSQQIERLGIVMKELTEKREKDIIFEREEAERIKREEEQMS